MEFNQKTYLLDVPFNGKRIRSVSGILNKINTIAKAEIHFAPYIPIRKGTEVFSSTLIKSPYVISIGLVRTNLRFEVCLFSLKSILLFIQAMLALHDTEIYFWFYFDRLIQATCTPVTMTSDTCVTAMCCHTRFIIAEKQCLWTDGNLDSTQPWRC